MPTLENGKTSYLLVTYRWLWAALFSAPIRSVPPFFEINSGLTTSKTSSKMPLNEAKEAKMGRFTVPAQDPECPPFVLSNADLSHPFCVSSLFLLFDQTKPGRRNGETFGFNRPFRRIASSQLPCPDSGAKSASLWALSNASSGQQFSI